MSTTNEIPSKNSKIKIADMCILIISILKGDENIWKKKKRLYL